MQKSLACAEESFKKALYQSVEAFTARDLEELYSCVDNEFIIDLAKRYKLSALVDIADEYEEELCPDAGTPISWSRFYDAFNDWKPEYAKTRLQAVMGFGSDDEVLEVAQELFWNDEYEASRFITRVLDAGVRFSDASPKYVLSLDRFDYSRDGIAHINIVDFLLGKQDINLL